MWRKLPVVILESSHPSRNLHWAQFVFFDLFGNGARHDVLPEWTAVGVLSRILCGQQRSAPAFLRLKATSCQRTPTRSTTLP